MSQNLTSPKLIAGIDHIAFDQRPFQLSDIDLKNICRSFSLGNLIRFQKERHITISHSNFFVYLHTTKGRFALKFYPMDSQPLIRHELAVNRLLFNHRFPTPRMSVNNKGIPFIPCNERLAACYEFIPGVLIGQHINDRNIIYQLMENMYLLKHILSADHPLKLTHHESIRTTTLRTLDSLPLLKASSQESQIIQLTLQKALKAVKDHASLLQPQWLHNNTTLTNFIIKNKTIYILDLSHIREDYALSDLSALIISCLFLKTPKPVINAIIRSYFMRHHLTQDHQPILSALLTTNLMKEYVKNDKREQLTERLPDPPSLSKIYLFHVKARKQLIISTLKKINGASFFPL